MYGLVDGIGKLLNFVFFLSVLAFFIAGVGVGERIGLKGVRGLGDNAAPTVIPNSTTSSVDEGLLDLMNSLARNFDLDSLQGFQGFSEADVND